MLLKRSVVSYLITQTFVFVSLGFLLLGNSFEWPPLKLIHAAHCRITNEPQVVTILSFFLYTAFAIGGGNAYKTSYQYTRTYAIYLTPQILETVLEVHVANGNNTAASTVGVVLSRSPIKSSLSAKPQRKRGLIVSVTGEHGNQNRAWFIQEHIIRDRKPI